MTLPDMAQEAGQASTFTSCRAGTLPGLTACGAPTLTTLRSICLAAE